MIKYDRDVIQKFADKLYKKANTIIASYAVFGLLLGGGSGYFLGKSVGNGMMMAAFVAVVGALIGFAIGQERAFKLKLLAQTALCQMKIEQNTMERGV